MSEPTEAMKAMARRIYAQFIIDNTPGAGPDDVPQFDDNAHGVKIALAAIIETTEAAARLAENIGSDYGMDETGWFDCTETVALQLRSGQQFRKDV